MNNDYFTKLINDIKSLKEYESINALEDYLLSLSNYDLSYIFASMYFARDFEETQPDNLNVFKEYLKEFCVDYSYNSRKAVASQMSGKFKLIPNLERAQYLLFG